MRGCDQEPLMVGARMEIVYRTESPDVDQFWRLYQTTGWNDEYHLNRDDLALAMENTWCSVCAYARGTMVGFGRVVTDRVMHAMIYDMIVDPDYRGMGIGGHILDQLVEICRQQKIRDIQLFCATGKETFYGKHGFLPRPPDAPGMQFQGG